MKKKKLFIKQSEFANAYQITQQRVYQAIKEKNLVVVKGKGINIDNAINQRYIQKLLNNSDNSGNRQAKKEQALVSQLLDKLKNPGLSASDASEDNTKNEQVKPQKHLTDQESEFVEQYDKNNKYKLELDKLKVHKASLELAEKMNILIPLEFMNKFWGMINGSLESNILSLPERMPDEAAAICGVTDPGVILDLKNYITEEVTTAMAAVKLTAVKYADSMKS